MSSLQAMAGLERAWVQVKPEGGQKGRSHRRSTQPHPISTHTGASIEIPSPKLANPFFPATPCAGCNNTLSGTDSPEHAAPTRVHGLKQLVQPRGVGALGSHLTRARGVKWGCRQDVKPPGPSPHIVRRSKYRRREWRDLPCRVTPYVGKWTERTPSASRSRPPPAPLRGCAE